MAGVPTISLLIGDADALTSLCDDALGASDETIAWSSATEREAIARDWWNEIVARRELASEAIALIAAGRNQSLRALREGWRLQTTRERLLWLERCDAPELASVRQVLRATLEQSNWDSVDNKLRALMSWLPRPEPLGLLVDEGNITALQAALALALEAPRLPILASVDERAWSRLRPQLDDRSRAVLEQGVITLSGRPPPC
jgi:hypothetical protein